MLKLEIVKFMNVLGQIILMDSIKTNVNIWNM